MSAPTSGQKSSRWAGATSEDVAEHAEIVGLLDRVDRLMGEASAMQSELLTFGRSIGVLPPDPGAWELVEQLAPALWLDLDEWNASVECACPSGTNRDTL